MAVLLLVSSRHQLLMLCVAACPERHWHAPLLCLFAGPSGGAGVPV